jgi:homoserine dehydrogenase
MQHPYFPTKLNSISTFIDILFENLINKSIPIIIADCTSSEDMACLYPYILSKGFHIVAANKKAFSISQELYHSIYRTSLKYKTFCFYEATVGAGLPIISTITDMLLTGDTIYQIEGVFSGTLSFIFESLALNERSFFETVFEARKYGYTVNEIITS